MRTVAKSITVAALLGLLGVSAGCAYTCHNFEFREAHSEVSGWRVNGEVARSRPADWQQAPGSWPHWAPRPDDQYTVTLRLISPEPSFWQHGRAAVRNVAAIAGTDTVVVGSSALSSRMFSSDVFFIPTSIPDTLFIEFELEVWGATSDSLLFVCPFRAAAVASKHRRWHIADMAES